MEFPERRLTLQPNHWWQSWKWIAALAFLIFSTGITVLSISIIQTKDTVDNTSTIVQKLDKNQSGTDELVNFVHEVQAQQSATSNGQSKIVNDIITLLCSSSDQVRVDACIKLGYKPGG